MTVVKRAEGKRLQGREGIQISMGGEGGRHGGSECGIGSVFEGAVGGPHHQGAAVKAGGCLQR